ncbi:glycosyltransferase [Sphingobacterium sp. E70]|nr:glycosyltransferase [Sphingobacterium sp. E70]
MPAYNAGKYIKESISSILNQTYTHFELLIINDGSTDNTLEIISGFSDQRIRVINNAQNMGLLYTRNLALIEVNTEFIAIMDSDDVAMPERLAIQLKELYDNPNIALIGSQASMIDENGKIIQEKMYPVIDEELLKASIPFYNAFVHSSVMIRSNVLRDLGGYKEDYAEDYDLFLRAATQYRIKNLPDILIHYRNHVSGISKEQVDQMDGNIEKIKAKYLSLLQLPSEKNTRKC